MQYHYHYNPCTVVRILLVDRNFKDKKAPKFSGLFYLIFGGTTPDNGCIQFVVKFFRR